MATYINLVANGKFHLSDHVIDADYVNQIMKLSFDDCLPSPSFLFNVKTQTYYPLNKQSQALVVLLTSPTKLGLNLLTGKIDYLDNKLILDITFLSKPINWFKNKTQWEVNGLTDEASTKASDILSRLFDTKIQIKNINTEHDETLNNIKIIQY